MERYAHVTAAQQRQAADLLDEMLTRARESVTESVTHTEDAVTGSRQEEAEVADSLGESGSGGRIRTYDMAVNSRPLYH